MFEKLVTDNLLIRPILKLAPADELWYEAKLESWAVHSLNSITIVFYDLV